MDVGNLTRFGFALRKGWRRLTGKSNRYIQRRYEEADYLDAYAEHTDIRVLRDPHAAVGGHWEFGVRQLEFLRGEGMKPEHRMLDIGCGTLRAGRHHARYLDEGHYTGIDISPGALDYARRLIHREGLGPRRPRLLLNEKKRLTFDLLDGEKFDFLMAFSVFTHLKDEHIDECFRHLDRVMHERSVFYFTYNAAPECVQLAAKDFRFPFAFFESLAARCGFVVEDIADRYDDPSRQRMAKLTVAP